MEGGISINGYQEEEETRPLTSKSLEQEIVVTRRERHIIIITIINHGDHLHHLDH